MTEDDHQNDSSSAADSRCETCFADTSVASEAVVDFNSLSLGDIASMRLEGCRVFPLPHSSTRVRSFRRQSHVYVPPLTKRAVSYHVAQSSDIPTTGYSALEQVQTSREGVAVSERAHQLDKLKYWTPLAPDEECYGEACPLEKCVVTAERETPSSCPERASTECTSHFDEATESFGTLASACAGWNSATPLFSPIMHTSSAKDPPTGLRAFPPWSLPELGHKVTPVVSILDEQKSTENEENMKNVFAGDFIPSACRSRGYSADDAGSNLRSQVDRCLLVECKKRSSYCSGPFKMTQERQRIAGKRVSAAPLFGCAPLRDGHLVDVCKQSLHRSLTGSAFGYYAIGERSLMQYINKQVVPTALPDIGNFTKDLREDANQVGEMLTSDLLECFPNRVVLQTTLLVRSKYAEIGMSMAQKHLSVSVAEGASSPLNEMTRSLHQSANIARGEEENVTTNQSQAVLSGSGLQKMPCKEVDFEASASSLTPAAAVAPQSVSLAAAFPLDDSEILNTVPSEGVALATDRKLLTKLYTWKNKVHSIDGVRRSVDNAENNLVVYVGMILMGWLEVIDLLGSGTFGQVFLCKDLRIASGRFRHPSEIDGEDFQYWQHSHSYIPFSDPSMVPTHSPLVAVKVAKSNEACEAHSVCEAEILVDIGVRTASVGEQDDQELTQQTLTFTEPPIPDPRCGFVAKILAHGICYGHHCIVMESYGCNMFEYIAAREFKGLPMYQIQAIGSQILEALTLIHEQCHVVHCDIKPENVLLTPESSLLASECFTGAVDSCQVEDAADVGTKSVATSAVTHASQSLEKIINGVPFKSRNADTPSSCVCEPLPLRRRSTVFARSLRTAFSRSLSCHNAPEASISQSLAEGERTKWFSAATVPRSSISLLKVKLIDFSSSFYIGCCAHSYMQSRYYRAPEVILLADCGPPLDIWSLGCFMVEMLLGVPLLPGTSDYHQLCLMEETLGPLPLSLLSKGELTREYYKEVSPLSQPESSRAPVAGDQCSANQRPNVFRLMCKSEYFDLHSEVEQVEWKTYFSYKTLSDLLKYTQLSEEENRLARGGSPIRVGCNAVADATTGSRDEQDQAVVDELRRQRYAFFDLIQKMLKGDPAERVTARGALDHPFFTHVPECLKPYLP
uniref:Protein kinase domain-containing protein n=1 Tax=Trypanosoma vivax (strain Y486) TaxID=1055687 RepID=G0U4N6_TRYVY|nr:putative protein kinase [Trypanosoma vivax Y486]